MDAPEVNRGTGEPSGAAPAARMLRVGLAQESELRSLAATRRRSRELARGEHLFNAADRCTHLYVIETGALELSVFTPEGHEQVVGLYFDRDVVGWRALGAPVYGCTATALEATRVWALPFAMVEEHGHHHPLLQRELVRLASRYIAQLRAHIFMLGRKTALERVAGFLLDLAARRGAPDGSVQLPLSLYGIGCYLSLALETVSRCLRALERAQVISKEGRRIHIRDRARLIALARDAGCGGRSTNHCHA